LWPTAPSHFTSTTSFVQVSLSTTTSAIFTTSALLSYTSWPTISLLLSSSTIQSPSNWNASAFSCSAQPNFTSSSSSLTLPSNPNCESNYNPLSRMGPNYQKIKRYLPLHQTRGVLPFYIKKYLKAKQELWKHKCFTMQKYNLQHNPLKETKILQDIITLYN
jgi:hypothetical protein